jgi:hypothetical protein
LKLVIESEYAKYCFYLADRYWSYFSDGFMGLVEKAIPSNCFLNKAHKSITKVAPIPISKIKTILCIFTLNN